jgi:hypothetical protein
MDMHLETDLFESFRKYQWRLIREYNKMSREFGFVTVDAALGIEEIQARIRRRVQTLLDDRRMQALSTSMDRLRPLLFEAEDDAADSTTAPATASEAPALAARASSQD